MAGKETRLDDNKYVGEAVEMDRKAGGALMNISWLVRKSKVPVKFMFVDQSARLIV